MVDSNDYPELLEYLRANKVNEQFRRKLAWKAFQHVASYDSAVSEWLWKQTEGGTSFLVSFQYSILSFVLALWEMCLVKMSIFQIIKIMISIQRIKFWNDLAYPE